MLPLQKEYSITHLACNQQLIVRRYMPSDLPQIVELEKRAFPVGPYSKAMLKRMFSVEISFSFVAEANGKVLGYVTAIPIGESIADVESIAVDPGNWGKGIGGKLLDTVEEEMRKRGFVLSILEVRDKNFESMEFYRKHGYVVKEHMETYYHELYRGSRGAYRMEKIL